MARGLVVVLVVALGAGLATGCGGDRTQDNGYVEAVNRAQHDFATTFARLSRRITSTSTASADRRTLGAFRAAVDRAVVQLNGVEVPGRVGSLHARLVGEIASYGRQIDRARAAFRSQDAQTILAAQTELVSAVTRISARINRTIDAINAKLRD